MIMNQPLVCYRDSKFVSTRNMSGFHCGTGLVLRQEELRVSVGVVCVAVRHDYNGPAHHIVV